MSLPNARWLAGTHTLLAVIVLAGLPFGLLAGAKKEKESKVSGYTISVQPASLAILDKDKGQRYIFVTDQDYTSRVGIGAEVVIRYTVENGVNHLKEIDIPDENFFVPADAIRSRVRRIIILPESQVPDSEGVIDRIGQYLTANLGWYVAPSALAEEVRNRTKPSASLLDEIDPKTGQFNMESYLRDQNSLISKLVSETRVDAVLEVDVEEVKARVKNHVAKWDGTSEAVAGKGSRVFGKLAGIPNSGWVLASTVVMKLWDPQGKLLWSKRRGFAALGYQTKLGFGYRQRPLADVYENEETMHQWLVTTLGRLAPPVAPRVLPAMPPESKQRAPRS